MSILSRDLFHSLLVYLLICCFMVDNWLQFNGNPAASHPLNQLINDSQDVTPALEPPKQIADPDDVKPADWDDRAEIEVRGEAWKVMCETATGMGTNCWFEQKFEKNVIVTGNIGRRLKWGERGSGYRVKQQSQGAQISDLFMDIR